MTTVSISVEETVWEAAQRRAAQARLDVSSLVRDYLGRLASGTVALPSADEAASRKRLLDLLKECNLALDGRPTRESFYTDRRFH
ncbi:MAG: hypothetical protein FJ387_16090 [Verrucomicrobia bacterium]|nr:hypothetical protein [Verrucomicrobiota bacterium]